MFVFISPVQNANTNRAEWLIYWTHPLQFSLYFFILLNVLSRLNFTWKDFFSKMISLSPQSINICSVYRITFLFLVSFWKETLFLKHTFIWEIAEILDIFFLKIIFGNIFEWWKWVNYSLKTASKSLNFRTCSHHRPFFLLLNCDFLSFLATSRV